MSGFSGAHAASAPAGARSLAGPAAILAFATAVVVTTEFIVVGLLPELARALDISIVDAGRFVSWFALASAILGPPLTIAASRMEPHRVVALALLAFAVGNLVATLMPSYPVILAVRVGQGAALPVLVSVGSAAIAKLAGDGREGQAVALVYLGVVVALVLAVPAGVALAGHGGWRPSFLSLAVLAAIGAAIVAAAFPPQDTGPASMKAQAMILRRPALQAHLVLSAVLFAAMFAAYSYLAAFLESVAGFDARRIAVTLMGFGMAGVFGNWIAGRVVDRGPMAATAGVAMVLTLAMAAVSLVGGRLMLLLPLLAIWGAAHTAAFLLCQVRVMLAAPAAPAFASSLNIAACNVGIAGGAEAGGWIVDHQGIGAVGFGGAALAGLALAMTLATWLPPARRSVAWPRTTR
jgi:MFS transporter, DHA1 family, inner membrane transport protein